MMGSANIVLKRWDQHDDPGAQISHNQFSTPFHIVFLFFFFKANWSGTTGSYMSDVRWWYEANRPSFVFVDSVVKHFDDV